MDAIAAAIDDLFADPHLARDGLYRAGGDGEGIPVRVLARRPDRTIGFEDVAVHTATAVFEVRVAEVPTPAEDDVLVFEGATYIVQGEPVRDAERLIWTLDTRPT
jgi:hypothetical protein